MQNLKLFRNLFYSPAAIWGDSRPAGREGPDCWGGGQAVGPQGRGSWAGQAEVRGHCHEDEGGEKADGAEDEGGRAAGCQAGGAVREEVWNHLDLCRICLTHSFSICITVFCLFSNCILQPQLTLTDWNHLRYFTRFVQEPLQSHDFMIPFKRMQF